MATIRIAAVSDIHYKKSEQGKLQSFFAQVAEHADILIIAGDMTEYGLPEEARLLAQDLKNVTIPMVGVLGNHDFESGQQEEVAKILAGTGLTILDGDSVEIRGIGFAGTKGFGGGFGRRALAPWGERAIKEFVQESVNEALKLEMALGRLQTPQRIGIVHYSPIQGTTHGEPPEIVPFLGSTRLEEPLDRYRATAVFHGHAHHGTAFGKTKTDIPVYNVCLPLLQREFPDRVPLRVIEVPVESHPATQAAVSDTTA